MLNFYDSLCILEKQQDMGRGATMPGSMNFQTRTNTINNQVCNIDNARITLLTRTIESYGV
jgi:hypothetical protein